MGIVMWLYLFFARFSFSGAVCSGVYLTDEDYDKNPNVEDFYLVTMGLFIKFMAIWTLIAVVLLCTLLTII